METLLKQQHVTTSAISRALDNFKKIGKNNYTYANVRNRLYDLKDRWRKCEEQHARLLELVDDEAASSAKYFKEDIFSTIEEIYNTTSDYMTEWLVKLEPKSTPTTLRDGADVVQERQDQRQAASAFTLPSIELPTFSGDYRDWEGFRDRFSSLVIDNSALSNVRRMHYLCSCLKQSASDAIKTLPITDANFTIAWNTLKSRYENKRRLIHVHLQTFFNLPPVTSGSVVELRSLRDQANIAIQSLKNLERPVDTWDDMLVFCVHQRLDKESRHSWELKLGDTLEYPTYNTLDKFLESRIRAMESMIVDSPYRGNRDKKELRNTSGRPVLSHTGTQGFHEKCLVCSDKHFLIDCSIFKSKTPSQRFNIIKDLKRCVNCFSSKHISKECTNKFSCRKCQKRHHTLLHFDSTVARSDARAAESTAQGTQELDTVNAHMSANLIKSRAKILLATAWIQVSSPTGRKQKIRALLDQGSEATFISNGLAQSLHAPRTRVDVHVSGIGGAQAGTSRYSACVEIAPCGQDSPSFVTNALILPSLTKYVPQQVTVTTTWKHVQGLTLADSDVMSAEPINMIVGADLYGSILLNGIRKGPRGQPVAQKTIFGWVLSGPISSDQYVPFSSIRVHFAHESITLDSEIKRFWEVEEIPSESLLSPDELKCEEHFKASHSRAPNGQYVVRLPFKQGPPIDIGESYSRAKAMLLRVERQLQSKPMLAVEYSKFLEEYNNLGHMELVPQDETISDCVQRVYLPHQAVIRDSSLTTKLRVVFNASSLTTNGSSLNDHLFVGPKLQADLPALILQWRRYRYVYCADISKMYRQILVDKRDVDYQRILWRSAPTSPVRTYQLLTVTYGTAAAPFQALRVIQQLAEDEGTKYPLAEAILRKNIYIDDCLFGANSLEAAQLKRKELNNLLAKGGFTLRKWASNSSALLENISSDDHGLACPKPLESDESLRILGVAWNPTSDRFQFQVNMNQTIPQTKRTILSTIAKLFDPLGWVTPIIITAKILMQRLWLQKCGWDDCLSQEIYLEWKNYYLQLARLNHISLCRWTHQGDEVAHVELHGFSDASNVAYGAVTYLRLTLQSGEIVTSLLLAKSKVAPLKLLSVPRLELQGAVLLAKIINYVQTAMDLHSAPFYCWTDSTIVLAWVKKHPAQLKTFIANRVSYIQTQIPSAEWRHVPTAQNPADCSSRGISVEELTNHALWWEGPQWLRQDPQFWPSTPSIEVDNTLLEEKLTVSAFGAHSHAVWDLSTKVSSWPRLLRVTAYVLRFVSRCRRIKTDDSFPTPTSTALSSEEVNIAKIFWLRSIQKELFVQELNDLKNERDLNKKSSLISLNPFLDKEGLMRVGGRLKNAPIPYQSKHPIILKSHPLVALIVRYTHLRNYHAGPQLTLGSIRNEFWILRARQVVRNVIFQCVACTREKAASPTQLMGELPSVRVTPNVRAFLHSGVDYAGPFLVRSAPGRGHKTHKTYVAVFVCMATRAVHLELVNGYSTEAFLAAFHRFCSRRGLPTSMYSDNGTTFRGADRELASSFKLAVQDHNFLNRVAGDGISWHFIPPAAPHFGGLWEAGVKSLKYHLKRVVGSHTLTYEEFITVLCQTEACLNSRPLAPLSDSIDDYSYLTPGHFLIGSAITTAPAPAVLDLNENRLSRWQLVRRMVESFWKQWSTEYLHTLQQRSKWRFEKSDVQPGCLILVRNSLLPPCKWELGRVVDCTKGHDNLVRVVKIKTAKSEYVRPITKICILPIQSYSDPVEHFATAGGDTSHLS